MTDANITRLLKRLVDPVTTVHDADTLLRSRVLASAILVGLLIVSVLGLINTVSGIASPDELIGRGGVAVFLLLGYWLARRGHYILAAQLVVISGSIAILGLSFVESAGGAPILYYLPLLIIVSSFFLPLRNTLFLFAAHIVSLVVITLVSTNPSVKQVDGTTLIFNLTLSTIIIVIDSYRTHLINTQQTALHEALTSLRQSQLLLIQSEKMRSLGDLVAGISHELNNPLGFINSNLYSLRSIVAELSSAYLQLESTVLEQGTEQQREASRAIRVAADLDFTLSDSADLIDQSLHGLSRISEIIKALHNFSRLDQAELQRTNLSEAIQTSLLIAKSSLEGRVTVVQDIDPQLTVDGYPAQLNQVFLNVIVNAAQAIETKGALTITGFGKDNDAVLKFCDTGIGMSQEIMSRIFDPFFTTRPVGQGVGMGLAIAYKIIVDQHKGSITVESAPGAGTTMTITLPKVLNPAVLQEILPI